jgi:hypothetical protein
LVCVAAVNFSMGWLLSSSSSRDPPSSPSLRLYLVGWRHPRTGHHRRCARGAPSGRLA